MKKGELVIMSMLMMVSTLGAMESTNPGHKTVDFTHNRYNNQSVEFVERGIKFYIFLDGQFDFNTAPTADVDYIYRNGRRIRQYNQPRGVRIERDYQGRIRRVGNVFVSYTWDDRIKRIGSVFVKYRHNRMDKVGNLKILYSRFGIRFIGSVKGYYGNYNPYYSNNWSSYNNWDTWEYGYYDPFFDDDDFFFNYESYNEDDDYYYYRTKGSKGKKGKIIKRKKANKSHRNESRRRL